MGLGSLIVRGALTAAAGSVLYASVISPIMGKVRGSDVIVEPGYVNPKSLSIAGKKNAGGNLESYLNYKSGDSVVSLPCKSGPQGPLCGTVDYWWSSVEAPEKGRLVESEWPALDNGLKHTLLSGDVQKALDAFYGAQGSGSGQYIRK